MAFALDLPGGTPSGFLIRPDVVFNVLVLGRGTRPNRKAGLYPGFCFNDRFYTLRVFHQG